MKKFISGMICGTVLFSTLSFANNIVAVLSQQKIMLDGNNANIMAYNIDGNNYFKLVDLAKEIGFNVKYDAKSNTVYINTKENYYKGGFYYVSFNQQDVELSRLR